MKVLLVDDEHAMLLAMRMMLAKIEGVELVGAFQSAAEALDFARKTEVDLAFLDIQLAGDSGLELARRLRSLNAGLNIVFTTSHTGFAMQAYDVYPLDYMVKPISRNRLAQTISRAAAGRGVPAAQEGEAADNRLEIRGLGCFEASSRQTGSVKWMSRKSMELFAYLVIHRGRSVAKARVIEELFPQMPYKNAETYLYTAVYQLRKALSEHGCKQMIVSAQEKYQVDIDCADVDFIGFEEDLRQCPEINESNAAAAMRLESRFTGELFEGIAFDWADDERERLTLQYESFARRLASWLLGQKQYREAARLAGRIAARNAFDEETHMLLLQAYGAMGDRQSFQDCYASYKQLLQEELGVQPAPHVEQLYERYR